MPQEPVDESALSADGSNNNEQIAIRVDRLTCSYGRSKIPALKELSLQIKKGEIFGLIGPNGAGKTTLFHCLLGLVKTSPGTIEIGGLAPDLVLTHRKTGYMAERLCYNKNLTALDFLNLHHALAGKPKILRKSDVQQLLQRVDLAKDAWTVTLGKFSRGMLQRVGLACALVSDPDYLFLDEPASGLDPLGVRLFIDILKQLNAQGTTIILNSHQLDQIESTCSRVAFIKKGQLMQVTDTASREGLIKMFEEYAK